MRVAERNLIGVIAVLLVTIGLLGFFLYNHSSKSKMVVYEGLCRAESWKFSRGFITLQVDCNGQKAQVNNPQELAVLYLNQQVKPAAPLHCVVNGFDYAHCEIRQNGAGFIIGNTNLSLIR